MIYSIGDNGMLEALAQFASAKYISLETFRKTGVGVRTPVWFAADPVLPQSFYVYSEADAGKVKRIRNNPRVRVAPCDVRGNLRGEWVDAQSRIIEGAEAEKGQELLRQKYGWMKRIGDFFSRLMGHKQALLRITIG
jgi:PPOX class probable F420-dependent enzyme